MKASLVRLSLLMLALGGALTPGCGDDDSSGAGGEAGTSGAPSGGTGDDGGEGGGGGSSGAGPVAGATATAPVECGSATCQSPAAAMGFMTACCFDAASSTCGASFMGNACSVPPEPDPRCPSVDVGGGFLMLASCCTADGRCGIDASQFNQGCVELAAAEAGAMMQGGAFMIDFPEPRACDDGDGAVDADAGK